MHSRDRVALDMIAEANNEWFVVRELEINNHRWIRDIFQKLLSMKASYLITMISTLIHVIIK